MQGEIYSKMLINVSHLDKRVYDRRGYGIGSQCRNGGPDVGVGSQASASGPGVASLYTLQSYRGRAGTGMTPIEKRI